MIEFDRLILDNAGPLHHVEMPLRKQGLTLIIGDNRVTGGNNGACKSMSWELLQILLDGTSNRELKIDGFVNRHRKDYGLFAEVDFKKDGHKYVVQKYHKSPVYGTGITVMEDGNEVTKKTIPKAIQQIRSIVGLTRQEFYNTVYLTGGYSHILISGTPAEKDFYMTQLFGLDVYDAMQKVVKEDLDELRNDLGSRQEKVYEYKMLRKEFDELREPSDEDKAKLEARVRSLDSSLHDLKKKHKKWLQMAEQASQRRTIEHRLHKLRKPKYSLAHLMGVCEECEKLVRAAEKSEVYSKQRRNLKEKLKALPKVSASLSDLKHRIEKFEDDLRRYNKLLPEAVTRKDTEEEYREVEKKYQHKLKEYGVKPDDRAHHTFDKILSTLRGRLAEHEQRIHALQKVKSAECPTCGHEIKDVRALRHEYERKVKTLRHEEEKAEKKLLRVREMNELQYQLESLRDALKKLPKADPKKVEHKTRKLGKLISALHEEVRNAERRQEYEKELSQLPHVHDSKVDSNTLRKTLKKHREAYENAKTYFELEKTLKDLPDGAPSERRILKMEKKISRMQDELYSLRSKFDEYADDARAYRKMEKRLRHLRRAVVKVREKKVDEEALAGLLVAFGRRGLRLTVLKHIAKVIAEALPFYTQTLFHEKELRIKVTEKENSFDLDFFRRKEQIPVKALSKGEKAKLSLALLLTNRRATPSIKHTNVLIVDEVLDAIDVEGYDGVIQTLRHLLDNSGVTSCFLVTQNPDIAKRKRDLFDQVWTAVKYRPGKADILFT